MTTLDFSFIEKMKDDYDIIKIDKFPFHYKIYDFFIFLFRNFPHKPANRFIHNLCKRFDLKGKRIIDVGCFTGYYSFYFHCERNITTGVELSNKKDYAAKRFENYKMSFQRSDIIKYFNSNTQSRYDFIFCSNFPAHYDTGDVSTSQYFASFFHKAISMLSNKGIFYYVFYSDKHKKVVHPVAIENIESFLLQHSIYNYQLNIIKPIDYEMIELVIYNNNTLFKKM